MGTKCKHYIYIATTTITSHGDHVYQCQRCRKEKVEYEFRQQSSMWKKHTKYNAYVSVETPVSIAIDAKIEYTLISRMNKRIADINSKIHRLEDELQETIRRRNSLIEQSNPHPIQ